MMRKLFALGAVATLAVTGFAASSAAAQDVPAGDPDLAIAQHQLEPKINEVLAGTIVRVPGEAPLRVDGIEVYNPDHIQLQGYSFFVCSRHGGSPEQIGTILDPNKLERTALASQDGWRFDIDAGIDRRGAVVMVNRVGEAVDTVDFSGSDFDVVDCLRDIPMAAAVAEPAPSPTGSRSAQRTPDYNAYAPVPLTPTFAQIDGSPNPV